VNVLVRLGLSAAIALGTTIAGAVIIAIVDLYLTGHGYRSITREIAGDSVLGVHVSLGDIVLLVAAAAAGGLAWLLLPRLARPAGQPGSRS
jgi:hypothetical protein